MIDSAPAQDGRGRANSPSPTRRAVVAVGLTVPAFVLAACTGSGPDDDGSAKAAIRLAASLQSGRFAGSPVTGSRTDSSYAAAVRGLGAASCAVRVTKVVAGTTKSTKVVSLTTSWVLAGGRRWSYPHTVTMTSADNTWAVQWASALVHPDLETGEYLVAVVTPPDRADITDARGEPMVKYRPVYRVGIDKTKASGAAATASATQLAKLLDVDAAAYAKSVTTAGSAAFVEAIVLRTEAVPDTEAARIRAIPGAVLIRDRRPLAPSAGFARAILGSVGPATAEIVTKSAGSKNPVTASDVVGLAGLQQQYDAQLRGTPTVVLNAVLPGADGPAATRPIATLEGVAPTPLRTTVRQDLQGTAEGLLKAQQSPSALVAMKPSTGEIVVAASGAASQGYDTALLGRYAPGSTFKVVASLALLRTGLKVTDTVDCTPTVSVQGRIVTNFPDYPKDKLGKIPFKTAIANSCNTVMIRGADRATQSSLAVAADSLGLMQGTSTGPFFGSVSPGDTGADHQVAMIGQGKILASPLGMATVAASVAQGARVAPYLLPEHKTAAVRPPTQPLTGAEAASLRELMRAVVTEGGATGLKSVAGPPVMAKTGTAEYGTTNPPQTHSWMIAIQGDLAVAVFVETGGYGGVTCLPIVKNFLAAAAIG